ncbi:MAG: carboxy-S-adenosyl-L-methionine synthase CmoA [Candidatus Omnitrophica bacterium]|nr:carboxy-S-adenosyl-L-methionine synthase CmoA [Candidatus Omnitrophota bacterium]
MRDQLFEGTAARGSDFAFTREVAEVFDDMLLRSVPFYVEQQMVIKELAKKFYTPDTRIYDLGSSTGTTLMNMARELNDDQPQLIGYDNSMPMVEKARGRIKAQGLDHLIDIRYGDINDAPLEPASIITLCWTLQFVRPLHREALLRRLYEALVDGGALIVTEKILTNSSDMNRLFIELYYEFKKRNSYSDTEILRKREALENVLIPYRIDENMALFRKAGFQVVETFFQWYNFVGFVCVKKP